MKLQRIIHHLEDGRRKYVTHNGEMEKWTEVEIENLRRNTEQYGPAAYTADFAKYGISARELREELQRDCRFCKSSGAPPRLIGTMWSTICAGVCRSCFRHSSHRGCCSNLTRRSFRHAAER